MAVEVRDDRIVTAPPIARRFTSLAKLARWMEKQGDLRVIPYTAPFDLEKESK